MHFRVQSTGALELRNIEVTYGIDSQGRPYINLLGKEETTNDGTPVPPKYFKANIIDGPVDDSDYIPNSNETLEAEIQEIVFLIREVFKRSGLLCPEEDIATRADELAEKVKQDEAYFEKLRQKAQDEEAEKNRLKEQSASVDSELLGSKNLKSRMDACVASGISNGGNKTANTWVARTSKKRTEKIRKNFGVGKGEVNFSRKYVFTEDTVYVDRGLFGPLVQKDTKFVSVIGLRTHKIEFQKDFWYPEINNTLHAMRQIPKDANTNLVVITKSLLAE